MTELEQESLEGTSSAKSRLGEKVEEFKQRAQEKARDLIGDLKEKAQERAKSLTEGLGREVSVIKKKNFDNIVEDAREYIADNPGKSISVALLAGFVLGLLIKKR